MDGLLVVHGNPDWYSMTNNLRVNPFYQTQPKRCATRQSLSIPAMISLIS